MGPINDEIGFEQGGKNSSEHWKTYNNEQLNVPQETDFGVHLNAGDVHVAAIGQADDTDIHKLEFLLNLTLQYCDKHHVVLSPTKTKLQIYSHPDYLLDREYFQAACSLNIKGKPIDVVTTTEHWCPEKHRWESSSHHAKIHSTQPFTLFHSPFGLS